jgi:O-antigen/teichoic acid export membrane protein
MSNEPSLSPPAMTSADVVAAPLAQRVAKGAIWTVTGIAARIASSILILPILTRLLSPEDFGLLQIAAPFLFFVMLFSDLGMQPALVVAEQPTRRLWSTAFWTGLGMATILTLALIAAAPLVAAFYNEPRAAPILQALSVTIFIGGTMIVAGGWLLRNMKFRTLAIVEFGSVTLGILAALAAAFAGWGVWSLVVQQVVMFALKATALCIASRAPLAFEYSFSDLKGIMGLSWGMTFLGTTALGLYGIAWRVMTMPIEIFAGGVFHVLIPTIGQLKNEPDRLRAALMKTYRTISLFTFPAMAGIAALSVPLTLFVFGEKFAPAASPIAALAIHGALQSLVTVQGTVFIVLGRIDIMYRWALISLAMLIVCLLIGVQWGLVGAGIGYLVSSLICSPLSIRAMMKLIGADLADLSEALLVHTLIAIVMGLIVFGVTLLLPDTWSSFAVLALGVPLGVAIYVGGLFMFDRKAIDDVLGMARSVLAKAND